MMSITGELVKFIESYDYDNIPDDIKIIGRECLLDTLGGCLLGSTYKDVVGAITQLLGVETDKGNVSIWGTELKGSLQSALLLNGTMGHTTETDDVHKLAKIHAGAIVVPTVLTLGEYLHSSGQEVLRALILGYEVALRIGIGIGAGSHRLQGWHATGTCGIFGAATAASILLKLSTDEMISALGMAGTQSSGLWAFLRDGASCKKFHAGKAAHGGVIAALMAKGGMTGPAYILEAEDGGLFKASSNDYSTDKVVEKLGENWRIKEVDRKPYPCCRSTHPGIDSMLALRSKWNIPIKEIKEIQIDTYEVGYLQCGKIKHPKSVAEAQFSTSYCAAVALLDGRVSVDHFTEDMLDRQDVYDLEDKISVISNDHFTRVYPKNWGCKSKIYLSDGKCFEIEIENASGDHDQPLGEKGLINKFMGLTASLYKEEVVKKLVDMILHVDTLQDVSSLVDSFRR